MSLNKQNVICHISIIALAIVLLGSSSVSVSASAFDLPFQSALHHHNKVFDKKQQDHGSSGSADTKSSHKSNNKGNSNNNNFDNNNKQGANDCGGSSDSGSHDSLQAIQLAKSGQQQQQVAGENIPPILTSPGATPSTTCEQGSNCTDQQGLNGQDRSSSTTGSATASEQNNNNNNSTPFVLSLPFP